MQFTRTLVSLVMLACPVAALADEPVWTFEVREVIEYAATSHVIRLVPAPPGVVYPRTCAEFVIRVTWAPGQAVPERLQRFFNRDGYAQAIQKIRQAQSSDQLLRLGSLDRGFGLIADAKGECEVASRGLGILIDRDQRDTVFSVY